MKYHCGLLDKKPQWKRILIRRKRITSLSPELRFELMVWMCMPGIPQNYTAHVFGHKREWVARNIPKDKTPYMAAVNENILSLTEEDVVALLKLRDDRATCPRLFIPIILDHYKRCGNWSETKRRFGITRTTPFFGGDFTRPYISGFTRPGKHHPTRLRYN